MLTYRSGDIFSTVSIGTNSTGASSNSTDSWSEMGSSSSDTTSSTSSMAGTDQSHGPPADEGVMSRTVSPPTAQARSVIVRSL